MKNSNFKVVFGHNATRVFMVKTAVGARKHNNQALKQ